MDANRIENQFKGFTKLLGARFTQDSKPVPHTDDVNLDILMIWLISKARLVLIKVFPFKQPSNSMVMMWEKR